MKRKFSKDCKQNLKQMPTAVLSYIFTFLSYKTNRVTLRHTCKRFYDVASLPTSIQPGMTFDDAQPGLIDTLPQGTALFSLEILGVDITDGQLQRLSPSKLTQLTVQTPLVLKPHTYTVPGLEHMLSHKLTQLTLYTTGSRGNQILQSVAQRCVNLQDLTLELANTPRKLHPILQNCGAFLHVTHLQLFNTSLILAHESLDFLAHFFPNLTHLTVETMNVDVEGFTALVHHLPPLLTSLTLCSNNTIDVLTDDIVCAWDQKHMRIQHLELQDCRLGHQSLMHLTTAPSCVQHLDIGIIYMDTEHSTRFTPPRKPSPALQSVGFYSLNNEVAAWDTFFRQYKLTKSSQQSYDWFQSLVFK